MEQQKVVILLFMTTNGVHACQKSVILETDFLTWSIPQRFLLAKDKTNEKIFSYDDNLGNLGILGKYRIGLKLDQAKRFPFSPC